MIFAILGYLIAGFGIGCCMHNEIMNKEEVLRNHIAYFVVAVLGWLPILLASVIVVPTFTYMEYLSDKEKRQAEKRVY